MDRNRELMDRAKAYAYKEVGETSLAAHVFYPDGHAEGQARPAILFFFSSTWDTGLISQFAPHCLHFAERGMVAMAVDYRVSSRHLTGPADAMADARSAFRWARLNASALGIDPEKIAGGGGSAGAHLVLTAAMIPGKFDDPADDASVSCAPNAIVAFCPIVDTLKSGYGFDRFPDKKSAKEACPMRYIRKGLPPLIAFHGTADRLIPFDGVAKFCRKYRRKKNPTEFVDFEGQGHSFYNFNVDVRNFEATINAADAFLSAQGFLQPMDGAVTTRLA